MKTLGKLLPALASAACLGLAAQAFAQTYPAKPIRMILTYTGGIDSVARLMAQRMTESLGQPVVVENQAGAGGAIGATTVARAAPDGYTLLSSTGSAQVQRGFMVKNVPYDAVKDFTPISLAWETVIVVGASPSAPFSGFKDMIDYAKKNPGKVSYATSGLGTSHHLALEMVKLLSGADIEHIPYKGSDQVVTDLVAGRVQVASAPLFNLESQVKAGKARYIAIMNNSRFSGLPDVPSIREVVPGFESPPLWCGFFGPAGLPQPIVLRLHDEMVKVLHTQELRGKLIAGGLLLVASTPEELAQEIERDIKTVSAIVKRANIQPE